MQTLASLHGTFAALWVVWFFVLFLGIVLYVMAPWRKRGFERAGEIPLRDDQPGPRHRQPPAPRG